MAFLEANDCFECWVGESFARSFALRFWLERMAEDARDAFEVCFLTDFNMPGESSERRTTAMSRLGTAFFFDALRLGDLGDFSTGY